MRLKSEIWVTAFLRSVASTGGTAVLVRRGHASAGAIYIRINLLNGKSHLYCPAPALLHSLNGERKWYLEHGAAPLPDIEINQFINAQISYDSDLWVVEVENSEGEHYLGDQVVEIEF